MAFKALCTGMIVLFLASCAVQYNDPDPIRWCVAYGIAGILTAFALAGRVTPLVIPAGLLYLAWSMYNMPHIDPSKWLSTEESRESGGLMMSAIWMAVLTAAWYRKRHASPPQN